MSHNFQQLVQVSVRYSCGCTSPKSPPVRMVEAFPYPGHVVICDKHNEFAVVVRASCYFADERTAIKQALLAADVDEFDAEYVAADQAR